MGIPKNHSTVGHFKLLKAFGFVFWLWHSLNPTRTCLEQNHGKKHSNIFSSVITFGKQKHLAKVALQHFHDAHCLSQLWWRASKRTAPHLSAFSASGPRGCSNVRLRRQGIVHVGATGALRDSRVDVCFDGFFGIEKSRIMEIQAKLSKMWWWRLCCCLDFYGRWSWFLE